MFVNGNTLGIIWNNNSFYLFDSQSRDSSGNPVIDGTAILLSSIHFCILVNILGKCTLKRNLVLFTSRFNLFKLFAPWKTSKKLS